MSSDLSVSNSLIYAVRDGRLEAVRKLINTYGLQHSQSWGNGYVLLRDAVQRGHTEVAKLLLTSGSRVNSKTSKPSNTPLHYATSGKDNIEILKMLLDKGASINFKNQDGQTPLHYAILQRQKEAIEFLLTNGANINARDKDNTSVLHIAVMTSKLEIVERLLNYGANVHYVSTSKYRRGTPLHFAIDVGSEEIATLLLSRGADIDAKDEDRITPFHLAVKKGFTSIAKDLLNRGASVHSSTLKENYTPLHSASELDDEELLKLLLNKGVDVNAISNGNLTPLHMAVKKGHARIVENLINHGASVHSLTLEGYAPLHFASEQGTEETVKLLLNKGADVNANTKDSFTPLHIATKRGYEAIVNLLLQNGAKVDTQDKDGNTVLHLAVKEGYLEIIENVLKFFPDINIQSNRSSLKIAVDGPSYRGNYKKIVEALLEYGFTVDLEDANDPKLLHAAVEKGYLKIVEGLLKYGANVNTEFSLKSFDRNCSLLHRAAKNKQEEVAILLIKYEADISVQDEIGMTPIYYAIENGCAKIVEALLQHNVDVNTHFGIENETPLHISAKKGNEKISTMLLNKSANVNAQLKNGRTALHLALQYGHKEVVKLLLKCGAKVECKDLKNITPLHLGAQRGCQEIIETLLKFGALINSKDDNYRTPLHIATQYTHTAAVTILLEYGADINILNGQHLNPLELVASLRSYYDGDIIGDILQRHIIKLKTAKFYVSPRNSFLISDRLEMRRYKDECKKEIASMKSEIINNTNISFYHFLRKCSSSVAKYLHNENIFQVLEACEYKTKFPIYASMIKLKIRRGVLRKFLLVRSNQIVHVLFHNFPELPSECNERIFSYLNNKDLGILINTCKPLIANYTNIKEQQQLLQLYRKYN